MDKNVTRKGLLALKDSKPVPITAHTHEIIIPCVYTETVKKVMKEKGIELPLNPHKLAELRRIAKATPGKYKADPSDHDDEGDSHAKGTKDLKKSKKGRKRKGGEDKEKTLITGKNVAVARAKTSANVLQNINKIMIRPPSIPQARPSEFSMVRPFSYAAQSTPETITARFKTEQKEDEKKSREEERKAEEERHRVRSAELLDTLTRRMEEQSDRTRQHIRDQLISESSWHSEMPSEKHQESVHRYFDGLSDVSETVPAEEEAEEEVVVEDVQPVNPITMPRYHPGSHSSTAGPSGASSSANDHERQLEEDRLKRGVVIRKDNTPVGTLILRDEARALGITVPRGATKDSIITSILRHRFGY